MVYRGVTSWTDARIERLKELWANGVSSSKIADDLGGVTRNGVIGKVNRLDLPPHRVTSRKKMKRSRRRTPRRNYGSIGITLPKPKPVPVIVEPTTMAPEPKHLHVLELNDGTCRWPYGDGPFTFCGAVPEEGLPYCEFHCDKAHGSHISEAAA